MSDDCKDSDFLKACKYYFVDGDTKKIALNKAKVGSKKFENNVINRPLILKKFLMNLGINKRKGQNITFDELKSLGLKENRLYNLGYFLARSGVAEFKNDHTYKLIVSLYSQNIDITLKPGDQGDYSLMICKEFYTSKLDRKKNLEKYGFGPRTLYKYIKNPDNLVELLK